MRERVPSDDRLVVLHRKRSNGRYELRRPHEHLRVDPCRERHRIVAHLHRHHDFFERGIACPLADAVDRAFDLPSARTHSGKRICDGHAEIVMAVDGKDRLIRVWHALAQHRDQREILLRHRVADRVRNVDRGGSALDRGLDAPAKEVLLGARAVLGRPLYVLDMIARPRHLVDDHFVDLVRLLLKLPLHMHGRGRKEGMDARPPCMFHGLCATIDVLRTRPGKSRDHGVLRTLRNLGDRFEIALRGNREPGFDDIDAHLVEKLGNFDLLFEGHGRAGALLAVAQRRVENTHSILVPDNDRGFVGALRFRSHCLNSFSRSRPSRRAHPGVAARSPECLGACARPALRGGEGAAVPRE